MLSLLELSLIPSLFVCFLLPLTRFVWVCIYYRCFFDAFSLLLLMWRWHLCTMRDLGCKNFWNDDEGLVYYMTRVIMTNLIGHDQCGLVTSNILWPGLVMDFLTSLKFCMISTTKNMTRHLTGHDQLLRIFWYSKSKKATNKCHLSAFQTLQEKANQPITLHINVKEVFGYWSKNFLTPLKVVRKNLKVKLD